LFLTLVIVPVIYEGFDKIMGKLGFNEKGEDIAAMMVEPDKAEEEVFEHTY